MSLHCPALMAAVTAYIFLSRALKASLDSIERAYRALEQTHRVTRSHTAYYDLALLHAQFTIDSRTQHQGADNTRLVALATYILHNYRSPSVYDETQSFIELLSPSEVNQFISILANPLKSVSSLSRQMTSSLHLS